MKDLQFRTNLIKWDERDNRIFPINAFALKDASNYGSELASTIAYELIPDMIAYAEIDSFMQYLDEYNDKFVAKGEDPVANIASMSMTDEERDAARILYAKFADTDWPANINVDKLMDAYFASPDVSKMNENDLNSVFIQESI